MNNYVCVEVNTLKRDVIKAKNFVTAVEILWRKIPNAKSPRLVGNCFIHYNK